MAQWHKTSNAGIRLPRLPPNFCLADSQKAALFKSFCECQIKSYLYVVSSVGFHIPLYHKSFFNTSTKSFQGLYFHYSLSVCVCVCVMSACEQNSSRTDVLIWMRFLQNGCLPHWLGPYCNWCPWVKCQDYNDVISIFSS